MLLRKERKIPNSVFKPHAEEVAIVQSNFYSGMNNPTARVYFPYPKYCHRSETTNCFLQLDHPQQVDPQFTSLIIPAPMVVAIKTVLHFERSILKCLYQILDMFQIKSSKLLSNYPIILLLGHTFKVTRWPQLGIFSTFVNKSIFAPIKLSYLQESFVAKEAC